MIQVEIRGEERLVRLMAGLNSFATDRRAGLLKEIGELMRKQHAKRILSEKRSADGAAWAPLKPSTVKKKGNDNILVESGRMAWAWNIAIGADQVSLRNTATSTRGKAVLYLPFHQFGTSKMIARPPLGISDQNMVEIAAVINRWISVRLGAIAA
jgi:phage gpG-like protein